MSFLTTDFRKKTFRYGISFLFILMMILAAKAVGTHEIILPEIAAMTAALWIWEEKSWLRQPEKIFILPTITATLGFLINMLAIPYILKLLIVLVLMILIINQFKYSLPPTLATGFLPIVTHAHEWSFLLAIIITTILLAIGVLLMKINKDVDRKASFNTTQPIAYLVITCLIFIIVYSLGYENVAVIPPLAVVVFESIGMKNYSLKIATKQTLILTLSIVTAVLLTLVFSNWILLSVLFMLSSFLLLYIFKMKVPAVYAFPFLVFVLPQEGIHNLPLATFLVGCLSFGLVYFYKSKIERLMISTPRNSVR